MTTSNLRRAADIFATLLIASGAARLLTFEEKLLYLASFQMIPSSSTGRAGGC